MHPCPECGVEFSSPQSTARHRLHRHGVKGKTAERDKARRDAKKAAEAATVAPEPVRRSKAHTGASPSTFELCLSLLHRASPSGTVRIDDLPEVVEWMRVTHEVVAKVARGGVGD
jgi:hypothetical protein